MVAGAMDSNDARLCAPDIPADTLEKAIGVYERWEAEHIFGDYTPAAPYAIRELVCLLAPFGATFSSTCAG